jgi:hypothetical protein
MYIQDEYKVSNINLYPCYVKTQIADMLFVNDIINIYI